MKTKKRMRVLFTAVLVALLLVSLFPLTVFAEAADTAKIGEVSYATLAAALAAVPTDGTETTVTMIADEAIDVAAAPLTIAPGQNVILDLNGKTVQGNCSSGTTSALITNKGTLTVMDSASGGKLIAGADPTWQYEGGENYSGSYASNLIRNEGTLTVKSGLLYNVSTGSAAYAIDNYNSGKITIEGGTLDTAKASAIRMFYNDGGALTVNGGVIGGAKTYMGIQVMAGNKVDVALKGGEYFGQYSIYVGFGGTYTQKSVSISGGTYHGYVCFDEALTNVRILDGKFGAWCGSYGDVKLLEGGVYAEKPQAAYIIDGKTAIANTDPETLVGYPWMLGVNQIEDPNVETYGYQGKADIPTEGLSTEEAAVAEASTGSNAALEAAAATLANDPAVVTEEVIADAREELRLGDTDNVTVYVKTYIKIDVIAVVEDTEEPGKLSEITLDVTPYYVLQVKKGNDMVDLTDPAVLTVNQPVVMQLCVPDTFGDADSKVWVEHKGNVYGGEEGFPILTEENVRYVEFVNPDGFSPFTLYLKKPAAPANPKTMDSDAVLWCVTGILISLMAAAWFVKEKLSRDAQECEK